MVDATNEDIARDSLWGSAFATYYEAYYQELAAAALIQRWQRVDEVTKVLVALTASGSAVTGFALWETGEFRVVWSIVAGFVAVLSIVHSVMNVSDRLSALGDIKQRFCSLRIDLATFRHEMSIRPSFDVDGFNSRFLEYRRRYQDTFSLVKDDTLQTKALASQVQGELDAAIANEASTAKTRG